MTSPHRQLSTAWRNLSTAPGRTQAWPTLPQTNLTAFSATRCSQDTWIRSHKRSVKWAEQPGPGAGTQHREKAFFKSWDPVSDHAVRQQYLPMTKACRPKSLEDLLEMTGRRFQLGGRREEEGKSLQRNGSFYRHWRPSTKKNLFFFYWFVYNMQL